MTENGMTITQHAALLSLGILVLALFLALWRLARGPALPDRVVALDLIAALVIGIIAAYSAYTGAALFLDAAVMLALISFLGAVAFAGYLERGSR